MSKLVVFDEFGGPDVLRIVDEPVPDPWAGQVRLRVEAFAVNPLDAMMRAGTSPAQVRLPHARLGIEATGTVDALGAGVDGLQVGDPVVVAALPDAATNGSYAQHLTLPATAVVPRPAGLSTVEAAAAWVAYATAHGSLVELAAIGPGDTVLVAGASGAVGRAALYLADRLGAVSLAVTRDASRSPELLAAGAAHVVATDREDLEEAVRGHTGGRGADIVLDLVRGPGQTRLLRAARDGGTLVAAGYLDPRPTPDAGGTTVTVLTYRGWDHLLDPAKLGRTAASFEESVRLHGLRPAVDTVFSLDEVAQAHRRFEEGLHGGRKIVVDATGAAADTLDLPDQR